MEPALVPILLASLFFRKQDREKKGCGRNYSRNLVPSEESDSSATLEHRIKYCTVKVETDGRKLSSKLMEMAWQRMWVLLALLYASSSVLSASGSGLMLMTSTRPDCAVKSSSSVLRLRGGEGLLDRLDRTVTDYVYRWVDAGEIECVCHVLYSIFVCDPCFLRPHTARPH